jgi:restriction system protein
MKYPDGLQARDALSKLQGKGRLTEYEKETHEYGSVRFEKIVRFATIDTVKGGWLAKTKGRCSIPPYLTGGIND